MSKKILEGGVKQSLTVPDVARSLLCSDNTVRSKIAAGELEAWRLGNDYRIEPDALEDFKKRMLVNNKPKAVGRLRAVEDLR